MTKYIDKHDAAAIRRKVERTLRQHADAAAEATAPALVGVKDENKARGILEEMVRGLIREIDELEREFLQDIDAIRIDVD